MLHHCLHVAWRRPRALGAAAPAAREVCGPKVDDLNSKAAALVGCDAVERQRQIVGRHAEVVCGAIQRGGGAHHDHRSLASCLPMTRPRSKRRAPAIKHCGHKLGPLMKLPVDNPSKTSTTHCVARLWCGIVDWLHAFQSHTCSEN